jgi:hypothetical protein
MKPRTTYAIETATDDFVDIVAIVVWADGSRGSTKVRIVPDPATKPMVEVACDCSAGDRCPGGASSEYRCRILKRTAVGTLTGRDAS